MRYSLVIMCWVLVTSSTLATKISLEDIERDNLKSEKRTIQPKLASASPTDFGFVPVKTIQDYARQQPKQHYVQPQYVPAQHYTPPPTPQQQYAPPAQQYEQYTTLPQQYYYHQQQPHNQYQQYENVQYITDNSIAQPQQYYQQAPQQQYYQPQQHHQQQYVYLQQQQYTAPSTSIQTIVDPKGGLQYVMYIPTYVPRAEQSQNYEDVVYADPKAVQPNYQEVQYQTPQVTPGIKYATEAAHQPEQASISVAQAPPSAAQPPKFYENRAPKSLLDSYVPSYLQVQYYKQQQQAQANALQHQQNIKLSQPITGKVEYVKRPAAQHHQHNAESVVKYNFQVPSAFHKK